MSNEKETAFESQVEKGYGFFKNNVPDGWRVLEIENGLSKDGGQAAYDPSRFCIKKCREDNFTDPFTLIRQYPDAQFFEMGSVYIYFIVSLP